MGIEFTANEKKGLTRLVSAKNNDKNRSAGRVDVLCDASRFFLPLIRLRNSSVV